MSAPEYLDTLRNWGFALAGMAGSLSGLLVGLWRSGSRTGSLRREVEEIRRDLDALLTWREKITAEYFALSAEISKKPDREEVQRWFESLREDIRAVLSGGWRA